jgi:hypothetical protein
VGELGELPWEWLFDPNTKRLFALTHRTSLTRWKQPNTPPPPSSIPPRTLRVAINAETVNEEVLALARDLGASSGVETCVGHSGNEPAKPAQVAVCFDHKLHVREIPPGACLIVIDGVRTQASAALSRAPAFIALPENMPAVSRSLFISSLTQHLAQGAPVDIAVSASRRKLAEREGIESLTWALPVLTVSRQLAPLVTPTNRTAVQFTFRSLRRAL